MQRRRAHFFAIAVRRFVAFPDRLQQFVRVELVLIVVLDVTDIRKLKHHKPVARTRSEKPEFVAGGGIAIRFKDLLRLLGADEHESFRQLDLRYVLDVRLARTLNPLEFAGPARFRGVITRGADRQD